MYSISFLEIFYREQDHPWVFDNENHHQGGHTAVMLGSGHHQLLNRAITVFGLGKACLYENLELTGIEVAQQVVQLAFVPTIYMRFSGRVCGDHQALLCKRPVHLVYRLRRLQSKKLFIQYGIFHVFLTTLKTGLSRSQ